MRIGRRLFSTKGTAVDQIPAARRVAASVPLVRGRQKKTPRARFPTIRYDIQRNCHRSHAKCRTRPQENTIGLHSQNVAGFKKTRAGVQSGLAIFDIKKTEGSLTWFYCRKHMSPLEKHILWTIYTTNHGVSCRNLGAQSGQKRQDQGAASRS